VKVYKIGILSMVILATFATGSLPTPCLAEETFMNQTELAAQPTKRSPIETKIFKGSFEHPKFKFNATFYIDDVGPVKFGCTDEVEIAGKIVWQLEKSPHKDEQSKIGLTAIEYVVGTFSPSAKLLSIRGYAIDDPNKLNIALDQYELKWNENDGNQELHGGTAAHTDGLGKVSLTSTTDVVTPPIVLSREVPCNIEELWSLWTVDEKLKKWLAEDAKVSTRAGATYELFWEPDHPERNSTKDCIVLDQDPQKVLVFTWRGPVPFSDLMNTSPPPTYVRVRFEQVDKNHSKVELTHYGWGSTDKWKEAKSWQENAWRGAFDRM